MGLLGKLKGANKKMNVMYYNVKLKEKISVDDLYEIVCEGEYKLGKPEITGNGIMRAIRFAPMGKYQITIAAGKTVNIAKNYADVKGFAKEVAIDSVTDGWYHSLNSENLDGNALVQEMGKQIESLLGEKGLLK